MQHFAVVNVLQAEAELHQVVEDLLRVSKLRQTLQCLLRFTSSLKQLVRALIFFCRSPPRQ